MLVGHLGEIWIRHRAGFNEIDGSPKQIFQRQLQSHVAAKRPLPAQILEIHKKIQIAFRGIKVPPRGGPE